VSWQIEVASPTQMESQVTRQQ
jgi:hypothetical protein